MEHSETPRDQSGIDSFDDHAVDLRVALVFPNQYAVGMANLGFQTVYRLFKSAAGVFCDRAFLPSPKQAALPLRTLVSRRRLTEFDIVAFSVSIETDYTHVVDILNQAALPLRSDQRSPPLPLVIAGGVACWLNPEPLAPFMDAFIIGEAEAILPQLLEAYRSEPSRQNLLFKWASRLQGIYVPRFYHAQYNAENRFEALTPIAEVPDRIQRVYVTDLDTVDTETAVLTPEIPFGNTFLIEVSRGCAHGCRFCAAGYVYRPPRFRSPEQLGQSLARGAALTDKVGLVGAAVSDLPGLQGLCQRARDLDLQVGFSSLRADALDADLIQALRGSGSKTATIAPEAGSQRLRDVINKHLDERTILSAVDALVTGGILNLRLYFMIGLPSETEADIEALLALCQRIKDRFLTASRSRGRIGQITVSLNSFVPKPHTPFQWVPMATTAILNKRIRKIRQVLKKMANVRLHTVNPKKDYHQALLARGDRRVSRILTELSANHGNWPQSLRQVDLDCDPFVYGPYTPEAPLPWDHIDHGVSRAFLHAEYQRAMEETLTKECPMTSCNWCGVCGD